MKALNYFSRNAEKIRLVGMIVIADGHGGKVKMETASKNGAKFVMEMSNG